MPNSLHRSSRVRLYCYYTDVLINRIVSNRLGRIRSLYLHLGYLVVWLFIGFSVSLKPEKIDTRMIAMISEY